MDIFLQVLVYGIAVGALYGLIALGFVLVFKTTGAFNMAQGEFLMALALLCWTFWVYLKLPALVAMGLTIVVAIILGYLIERVVLRPMVGKPLWSLLGITLGMMYMLRSIALFGWGTTTYQYPPWFPEGGLTVGNVTLAWAFIIPLIIVSVLLLLFAVFFNRSRFALAMRSVGENFLVSQIVGIKLRWVYGLAWAFALVVAAIGGIIMGTLTSVNNQLSGFGLYVLPAIIIGGLTSIPGAIVGGLICGVAEKLCDMYLQPVFPGIPGVIPYVIAIIVLYIKPEGLWGEKVIERI